jgi:PhoPQ-activated pathogenicity-related protein
MSKEPMNSSQNYSTTASMPIEVVLWMRQEKNCRQFKYQRFFRELIQTIPRESALRLLRVRLQQEPRFKGKEVSERTVLEKYQRLLA